MRMPDAYIILFVFLVLAAVATYVIQAGEVETEESSEGIEVIVPDTYSIIDSNPAGFLDIFSGSVDGLISTSNLIFLVLIIGRSEEHTSDSSHVSISYAVFCLTKKRR